MVLNVCVPPLEDQERQSRLDQVLSCGLACREVRVVRRAEELDWQTARSKFSGD